MAPGCPGQTTAQGPKLMILYQQEGKKRDCKCSRFSPVLLPGFLWSHLMRSAADERRHPQPRLRQQQRNARSVSSFEKYQRESTDLTLETLKLFESIGRKAHDVRRFNDRDFNVCGLHAGGLFWICPRMVQDNINHRRYRKEPPQ